MNNKLSEWYYYGGRIPRKLKKAILGEKINKGILRKMLAKTVVGEPIKTMYERVEFTPFGEFCPKCGEPGYIGTGNRTEYPEHWETFRCLRCRTVVGYIDNSPFIHALECKDNNYDPTF